MRLAAISAFETGWGTSRVFRQLHNVGGITGPGYSGVGGNYKPFRSVEESIFAEAAMIARKQARGLTTLEKLAWDPVYGWAPIGVSNDPNKTNRTWPANVRAWEGRIRAKWNEPETKSKDVTINYNVGGVHIHGGDADDIQKRLAQVHRRHIDQMKRELAEVATSTTEQPSMALGLSKFDSVSK